MLARTFGKKETRRAFARGSHGGLAERFDAAERLVRAVLREQWRCTPCPLARGQMLESRALTSYNPGYPPGLRYATSAARKPTLARLVFV